MAGDDATVESQESIGSRYLFIIVVLLLCIAVGGTLARVQLKGDNSLSGGDRLWTVTHDLRVLVLDKGAALSVSPPRDTRHVRLYGQSLSHAGFRLQRGGTNSSRDTRLIARHTGEMRLSFRYQLHQSQSPKKLPAASARPADEFARWLAATELIIIDDLVAQRIIDEQSHDTPSPEELTQRLLRYAGEHIRLKPGANESSKLALKHGKAGALGIHRAAVALLRAARVPARIVSGIDLDRLPDAQPVFWVEYFEDEDWQAVDVVEHFRSSLPQSYVPFRKADKPIVEADDKVIVRSSSWSIKPDNDADGLTNSGGENWLTVFDLTRLSPETRATLGLLLLLPLGVLFTEAVRQLIGVRTYGTFTPTLLALAVVYAELLTAAAVFGIVIVMGILGRSFLPGLNLSRVPRLSVVFITVAMSMALVLSLLMELDATTDPGVVLLPIVILTTLIDRIYTLADKQGVTTALQRLGWTTATAAGSLLVLLQDDWGEFFVRFPELHAITLLFIILLGRCREVCLASSPLFRSIQLGEGDRAKVKQEDQAP